MKSPFLLVKYPHGSRFTVWEGTADPLVIIAVKNTSFRKLRLDPDWVWLTHHFYCFTHRLGWFCLHRFRTGFHRYVPFFPPSNIKKTTTNRRKMMVNLPKIPMILRLLPRLPSIFWNTWRVQTLRLGPVPGMSFGAGISWIGSPEAEGDLWEGFSVFLNGMLASNIGAKKWWSEHLNSAQWTHVHIGDFMEVHFLDGDFMGCRFLDGHFMECKFLDGHFMECKFLDDDCLVFFSWWFSMDWHVFFDEAMGSMGWERS